MRNDRRCFCVTSPDGSKLLFFSQLNTTQAVERIKAEVEVIPEVQVILDFIERSNRGLVK